MFEARVLAVLIASPGDTVSARDAVEQAIASWNRNRARRERAVLLPVRWETDTVSEVVEDAQAVVNRQLVDEADVVVALFYSRVGAPTPRAMSGTVEEIERARVRDVPVHVYFSEMPLPRNVDPEDLRQLNEFREDIQARGLMGTYASLDDLAAKVRTALERDVEKLVLVRPAQERSVVAGPGAILRARYEFDREPETDSRGRTTTRTRRQRLVIENLGTAPAEDVDVTIDPVGEGLAPRVHQSGAIERVLPRAFVSVMLSVYMGGASQWRVTLRWREGEEQYEEAQTVTPF